MEAEVNERERIYGVVSILLNRALSAMDSGAEYSIFDVHELAVLPVDIDDDGRLNPDDPDSDDDTLPDGEDPSPWGSGSMPPEGALFAEIDIQLADGSSATLMIDNIEGNSGETARLASLSQPLQLQFPPGWPVGSRNSFLQSKRWTAFEWRVDDRGLCSNFRIPLDVSSLQLHSSTLVLHKISSPEASRAVYKALHGVFTGLSLVTLGEIQEK